MASTCSDSETNNLSLADSLAALKKTVSANFGEDFIAETIPFGILFKERAKVSTSNMSPFITGTGSCTFCKDNDSPDVD